MPEERLDEMDADEWYDVCRRLKPDLERDEFDEMWDEYHREKAERLRRSLLN